MSARDYAVTKLFRTLGIAAPYWHSIGPGLTQGGGGLLLAPRDAAKIGLLYLHDGEWEGQRLLQSAGSIASGTRRQTCTLHSILPCIMPISSG